MKLLIAISVLVGFFGSVATVFNLLGAPLYKAYRKRQDKLRKELEDFEKNN